MNDANIQSPRLIIVMGVSGCGKTTLAKALAEEYQYHYMEADDFHSADAKHHMAQGRPLTDAMREPWILAMLGVLRSGYKQNQSYVLSYSGLKRLHRKRFRRLPYAGESADGDNKNFSSSNMVFLMLNGDKAIIEKRMKNREDHFMPSSLLDSQIRSFDLPMNEDDIKMLEMSDCLSTLVGDAKSVINGYFSASLPEQECVC